MVRALLLGAASAAFFVSGVCAEPVGALNPAVTQDNIKQTVCVPGWTKTVRPPVAYTTKLKIQQLHDQHLAGTASDYEEDHMIPLSLGGAPSDPANLWPQAWPEARQKDAVENMLHRMLCKHEVSLERAQTEVRHWRDYISHSE